MSAGSPYPASLRPHGQPTPSASTDPLSPSKIAETAYTPPKEKSSYPSKLMPLGYKLPQIILILLGTFAVAVLVGIVLVRFLN